MSVAIFNKTFKEVCGYSTLNFQNLIRFIALTLLIIAVIAAINHFLNEKMLVEQDLITVFARIIKAFIGLLLFIGLLMTIKGN